MTVGFHSPLPPDRTGVADYSAALLPALRRLGPVTPGAARADIHLYHLGNNLLHAPAYRRALERPGVTVLHDAVLNHFYLGYLSETAYHDEFVYNYGEWHRGLARDLYRARAASPSDDRFFRYPMLKRPADQSLAVIVHNPAAARAVRDHAPGASIHEIPHYFAPPALPGDVDVLRYRETLGLDPGWLVFGVFGYLRESKRLFSTLRAFDALHREYPRTALLIAGDIISPHLERALSPVLSAPGVFRLPYLSESDFWLTARAVDACVNLRYPSAGETSGIAVRLMGLGKPVLVTEGEEYERIPEGACLRIACGAAECDSLFHHMVALTAIDGLAREIGSRAAAHIASHHTLSVVAARYWQVLTQSHLVTSEQTGE